MHPSSLSTVSLLGLFVPRHLHFPDAVLPWHSLSPGTSTYRHLPFPGEFFSLVLLLLAPSSGILLYRTPLLSSPWHLSSPGTLSFLIRSFSWHPVFPCTFPLPGSSFRWPSSFDNLSPRYLSFPVTPSLNILFPLPSMALFFFLASPYGTLFFSGISFL